jgi:cell division protein FtsI/penicillin-binding protein 2
LISTLFLASFFLYAHYASFIGWGPLDDPRFLVYVWLERPKSSPWGSEVAAPVFKQVVEDLVVLIELPPDKIRKQLMNEN